MPPPKAFIFRRKTKPGVTSTSGPHKPRHHYKTQVPKVQKLKPEALRGRDRVPGGGGGKKKPTRECSADPPRTPAERRTLGPSGPSRRLREAGRQAGRRAGLPPEPGDSRPTLAGVRGKPEETAEPRAGRVGEDAAAAEAVAAPPPPARPNRRCDATGRANAGPNRRPAEARARRRRGPAPHAARASTPRARYSSRRPAPPPVRTRRPRFGPRRRETAELILTQGSGARGRRNPPSSEAAAAAAASSGAAGGGDASPLPAAGRRAGGEGRGGGRWSDRGGGGRGGPRRLLARSLPPSGARPPAALSPTHSHGERRAPRQPLRRTGPAP
ncbi:translation initiation factor IF-2-like [Acinonyx jubatus]|uniref:Translation initiation factor IF-2-like n=1 Tax=Acinonyx jubatus TaxID=32536 RepID=A0ABM3PX71_ACIJB|nr:translation initiation factor IF-2-like [Acinonyx jubatus]